MITGKPVNRFTSLMMKIGIKTLDELFRKGYAGFEILGFFPE